MSADWMMYNETCPHCGGTEFLEQSVQTNIVKIEERESGEDDVLFVDYAIEDIIVDDTDIQEVWCRSCDTQVF